MKSIIDAAIARARPVLLVLALVLAAVLLVMIVVVAALGVRTAGLVGVSIPDSFLAGILVLAFAGLTINIVVLFALIMAVGMLVDGTIVVVELADRRMAGGLPRQAAYAAAVESRLLDMGEFATVLTPVLTPSLLVLGERLKFGRRNTAEKAVPAVTHSM